MQILTYVIFICIVDMEIHTQYSRKIMDPAQMVRIFQSEEDKNGFDSAIKTVVGAVFRDFSLRLERASWNSNLQGFLFRVVYDLDKNWQEFAQEIGPMIKVDGFRSLLKSRAMKSDDYIFRSMANEALDKLDAIDVLS